jgi:hypothetical protein
MRPELADLVWSFVPAAHQAPAACSSSSLTDHWSLACRPYLTATTWPRGSRRKSVGRRFER